MIDKDIDTGGIMLRQECPVTPEDTAGTLHDKMMPIGAELVVTTVQGIIEKNIETRVQRSFIQGSEVLKPAPKLTRELCHIDWNDSTKNIYNLIRGLSPYPTAFTELVHEGAAPAQLKIYFGMRVEGDDYMSMLAKAGKARPSSQLPPPMEPFRLPTSRWQARNVWKSRHSLPVSAILKRGAPRRARQRKS